MIRLAPAAAIMLFAACAAPAPPGGTAAGSPAPARARTLDDFDAASLWTAAPAAGVALKLERAPGRDGGNALRAEFDFRGGGGWAAFRRELAFHLPDNYELSFWLRGEAPRNTLELKLIDETGENVWWVNRPEFEFGGDWRLIRFRKRHVTFAWGPARGGEIRDVAALEFAITAGTGGSGTIWIDDVVLTPLEPVLPYDLTPRIEVTSSAPDAAATLILDGDTATAWHSAAGGPQTLALDFLRAREYGGIAVHWVEGARARDYEVQVSEDGTSWETVRTVLDGGTPSDWLPLPETESRWLRLVLRRGEDAGRGYAIRELRIMPPEWGGAINGVFASMAAAAPRGHYPRYLRGEQSYWTVVGAAGDEKEALISEDGMVELDRRSPSVEPFLYTDGRLATWADARVTPSLARGDLPIPSVRRETGPLALDVTTWADGGAGASTLWLRYRVTNGGAARTEPTLYLALRPFQVNPSTQFLNNPGGAAPLREIALEGGVIVADGRRLVPVTRYRAFGAATLDQGDIVHGLARGALPGATRVTDPNGYASAALAYPLSLGPGDSADVVLVMPFHPASPAPPPGLAPDDAARRAGASLAATAAWWASALDRFTLRLPGSGARIAETVRTNLAWILVNQDGPAIQPGSRSYERSWIRDGSLTSAALLRLGHPDAVRAFIEWYAPFQYPDGKVPCCVDRRGADPVPEHDSHGELIYLITEYFRHTGDRGFLARMWPHVRAAAQHIDSLRLTRRTAEYDAPDKRAYRGMLPQSISHEGYSEKPMHSYWDDFFALRGLVDAAAAAAALGLETDRARLAAIRDEFRDDLVASLRASMALHGVDYLPGSVELGDFDATSTTVGVTPGGALPGPLEPALRSTFERYWRSAEARMQGSAWEVYTPYELRTVGTFIRLGDRRRAHRLLDWFFQHQRPAAWNHWAEVVGRDAAAPRFIGDMPHTWVGSDFIRSATDMLVYERETDDALVIGAGVLPEWVTAPQGVQVDGLMTRHGPVGYTMQGDSARVVVRLHAGLRTPPGGITLASPLDRPVRRAEIDGRRVMAGPDGGIPVPHAPATIVLHY